MKMIYLRKKRSGNFEFSNQKDSNHKFKTKKDLKIFWYKNLVCNSWRGNPSRMIKTTYRLSQVYFSSFNHFWTEIKRQNK